VLVDDDASDNRELIVQYLKPLGFELRTVTDGEQAVREYEVWEPDVVLMDLRMPVMDGYEAIKLIRQRDPKARILVVTASAFADAQREAVQLGADDVVGKPFRESELLDKIARILGLEYYFSEPHPMAEHAHGLRPANTAGGLPPGLAAEIRRATIAADFDRVVELADEVEQYDAAAASALRDKCARFDADGILAEIGTMVD